MLPAPPQSPKARQAPCSTLAFSGHVAPEVGVARNNLMLVPITSVPGGCISRLAWRWAEAGLAWPHPARHSTRAPLRAGGRIPSQAGPVPRRHRHSEGQVPSIWGRTCSQRRGRCFRLGYTKPYCQHPQGFPPRAGTRASPCRSPRPNLAGHGCILRRAPRKGCSRAASVPLWSPPP